MPYAVFYVLVLFIMFVAIFLLKGRTIFRSYSAQHRERRARVMRALLNPPADWRILDLGGGGGDHIHAAFPNHRNIVICDYSKAHLASAREKYGYETVCANACEPLPFSDKDFDLVFCSSVIEHVTGEKDVVYAISDKRRFASVAEQYQAQFASEIRRIGKHYWVQTPHPLFPLDSHTLLPSPIFLLPRRHFIEVLRFVSKASWWPAYAEADYHLLSRNRLEKLFPNARILTERSVGFPKSLIAVK